MPEEGENRQVAQARACHYQTINTLNVMRERQVGNGSLFDQTTTLLTASMGSANSHNFDDLPALVVDNRMKTAGHWQKKMCP